MGSCLAENVERSERLWSSFFLLSFVAFFLSLMHVLSFRSVANILAKTMSLRRGALEGADSDSESEGSEWDDDE